MKRILFFIMLAAFTAVSLSAATLKDVTYEKVAGGVDVKLKFDGKIKYEIFKLENPLRLVINLPSTVSLKKSGKIPMDVEDFDELRFSQFKKDMGRVVVQMKKWYPYFPERSENELILHFTVEGILPDASPEKGLSAAAESVSSGAFTGLSVGTPSDGGLFLALNFDGEINYTVKEMKKELKIEVLGSRNSSGKEIFAGDGRIIRDVKVTPLNGDDLAVSIALTDEFPYEMDKEKGRLTVRFGGDESVERVAITGVSSELKDDKVYLRFQNKGWLRYTENQLPKEEKIRLSFENAYIDEMNRYIPVRKGPVVEVVSNTSGNNVVSDIKLKENISYRIYRDDDDIVMEIESIESGNTASENTPVKKDAGVIKEISIQKGDITLLLTALAQETGYNIVMSKSVSGEVSIDLHNVPWEEALATILQSNGYAYRIKGNIIRVATPSEFKQEIEAEKKRNEMRDVGPTETRIVPISYSDAGDIMKIVKGTLSSTAVLMVDARTNTLIITDVGPRLDEAVELVKYLDKPTAQVMIEAKFIRVSSEVVDSLGINWQLSNNGAFTASDSSFTTTATAGGGTSVSVTQGTGQGQIVTSLLDTFDLNVKLTMLVSDDKAEIMAQPKITALNNETASFISGKKIPITLQDESGNTVSQLQEIGIKLDVKPTINASNEVMLEIKPEVSDLIPPADGADLIISTNSASTKLLVGDGKTAVIGGLVRKDKSLSTSGVPILKDIPIIGALFKNRVKRDTSEEILIFVTPHIILPSEF